MLPEFDNTEIAFHHKTNKDLRQAQFLFSSMSSPMLTTLGMGLTKWSMKFGLPVKAIIKKTIFNQFCGGESMEEAASTAAMLEKYGVGVIMDYGVEGKEDEHEFDKAVPEFIRAIKYAATKKNIPFISVKITGFARFHLLELIHAGAKLSDSEQKEWDRVYQRIQRICETAFEQKVMVLVDAEETWIQNAVNELVDKMMAQFNKNEAIIFNTFQMYCHGTLPYLKTAFDQAKSSGYILGAKLVRGAYMEKERRRAEELGYPSPIQPDKEATDRDYNAGLEFCLERLENLSLFVGTHNENSCLLAAKYLEDRNIPHNHPRVYFSQLFGMSDNISFNLAHQGYNVAKYLPYGPVKDVIPYLMRRAQENTSVAGQTGRELSLINKELQRRKLL
ncbi:MAG: proline dehydrogenase [Sphingobacteriales bacterium]|nr:MAG: proline dehydrogenase [Sphingobacteriales bacterium]